MRIFVLGAGYAGLTLARKLERNVPDDVELLVVEKTGRHLVQHEVHRVIRRPSVAEDIVVPLDEVLDRAEIRRATVTDVDPQRNVVTLGAAGSEGRDRETLDYDYAAVCLGAETAFYDLPGVEDHASPLKSIPDAERIREEFLGALDRAEPSGAEASDAASRDAPSRDPASRVVVGGAGLSGIQVAGELAALADERDAGERVTVTLVERLDSVAPAFPENFQRAVRNELEKRGVEVRTNAAVARATDETIEFESGDSLDYDQFVWTGGIRGPDALDGERPEVRNTLQVGDSTFVVGDAARVVDADGEPVPASAQAAVREARAVADNLARLVEHDREGDDVFDPRLDPFAFDSPGWLVSVGDGAVAQVGPTVLTGRAAKALKTTVGAGYLSSVGAIRNAVELVGEELG
ncbi:FAD-dependent oxidoreductase [Halorussus salilacus]|uniref:NAD(P)/FAD-dependent oxidoreductase n=1 Tax=Halorussus salilacus TaxID=2953750 RepID=UPI00209D6857|nr:FAD-dependent oxidoreductase [Halorussus salilacus]USZ68717.1 FAD-dependent oxidoreductase [Halorussus salilacus]